MTDARSGSGQRLRIAALFVSPWDHEFENVKAGRVPSHRLFGMQELAASGHRVLHHSPSTRPRRGPRAAWRLSQAWWLLRVQHEVDVVVATHEAAALPVLLMRRLGLVRRPVVVMTVAALDATSRRGFAGAVHRAALRGADVVTVFASAQLGPLGRRLRRARDRVLWVPLGVDTSFFTARDVGRDGGVLSVGTNAGKDFPTLMAALPGDTACTVVTDAWNRAKAERSAGGRAVTFRSDVAIEELRDLYARAEVVVLPLRESQMSSGQTVLLENLAMATPVIVSDVSGVADYLDAAVMCVVPAGEPAPLRDALDDPSWRDRARRGPGLVTARFTTEHLASALEDIVVMLVNRRSDDGQWRPVDGSSPTLS